MKKENMKEFEEYVAFLEENKGLVGLHQYDMKVACKYVTMTALATIETDQYEKECKITLSKGFAKKGWNRKKNILMHELIHGRVDLWKTKSSAGDAEFEEEDFVNDVTKGFEKLGYSE